LNATKELVLVGSYMTPEGITPGYME